MQVPIIWALVCIAVDFSWPFFITTTGVYDSSGLDVYFAKEARPIEGGMMFFIPGAATGQHPPLPGGQDDVAMETLYVESGKCIMLCCCGCLFPVSTLTIIVYSFMNLLECTSQWTEPLTVVQVHHHSHFMGLHQEVLVERDGKMLGPLRREKRYDYNHQSGVEPEANLRTLLPGDRLAATCHFDTSSVSSNSLVEIGEGEYICRVLFPLFHSIEANTEHWIHQ